MLCISLQSHTRASITKLKFYQSCVESLTFSCALTLAIFGPSVANCCISDCCCTGAAMLISSAALVTDTFPRLL
jgi:hypothetical protein